METTTSDQQRELISSFLEIAVNQTMETAIQFLKATSWKLEEAIDLSLSKRRKIQIFPNEEEQIPLPIPSRKDTLYDSSVYHTPSVPLCPNETWDRPPQDLLFNGSFQEAKETSSSEDLWLLVHLQSTTKFPSDTLNLDLWSNDAVSKAMEFRFMLWQVSDHTNEGKKISTFYKIDSASPVVLLIDPITGEKMRMWSGEIEAQSFLEDLRKYVDASPYEHIASLASNIRLKRKKLWDYPSKRADQDMVKFCDDDFDDFDEAAVEKTLASYTREDNFSSDMTPIMTLSEHEDMETCLSSYLFEFPVLKEEPKGDCYRSLLCSVCVRFPDGRRKQRKFLKNEPIQLLWSFCYSHMVESEKKAFKLVQTIPGGCKTLDYGANATFDQSGIANSMVSVTWE